MQFVVFLVTLLKINLQKPKMVEYERYIRIFILVHHNDIRDDYIFTHNSSNSNSKISPEAISISQIKYTQINVKKKNMTQFLMIYLKSR